MKNILIAVALLAAASRADAQSTSSSMSEHHAASGWKELDVFHAVMAATWHPAKTDDLKAIRAKADSLALTAKAWAASKVPAACDTKPIRDAIADVVKGSADVAALVSKTAVDADVKKALHDVHERFEVVEKGCKPSHH